MRLLPVFCLILPFFCGTPVYAGNVLLPSDSTSSNLGLSTNSQSSDISTTATTAATTTTSSTTTVNQTSTTSTNTLLLQTASRTLLESLSSDEGLIKANDYQERVFAATTQTSAPQFFNEEALDDFTEQTRGQVSIFIGTSPNYSLSLDELAIVKHAFGYSTKELQTNCKLRLTLGLTTSGDTLSMRLMAGQRRHLAINVEPIKILIQPYVICVPPSTLPQYGSVIFRIGDKLGVPLLASAECTAPKNDQGIRIEYKGKSTATCTYIDKTEWVREGSRHAN